MADNIPPEFDSSIAPPTPNELVQAFLTTASEIGVSVTVIYAFRTEEKTVTSAAANRKDANIPGALKWLGNADLAATTQAAQALYLHDRLDNQSWDEIPQNAKQHYFDRASAVLRAAIQTCGGHPQNTASPATIS